MNGMILLVPVLLPIAAGLLMALIHFGQRSQMLLYVGVVLGAEALIATAIAVWGGGTEAEVFSIAGGMTVAFGVDNLSRVFLVLIPWAWFLAGIFSFEYMEHEERQPWFYGVYLVVGGILAGLALADNLLTYYVFYEFMSLTSMPLVLHERTHESIMAAQKYLFYSMAGALMVLFGFFVLSTQTGGGSLSFTAGGMLAGQEPTAVLLLAVFLAILGFGAKAGMFPMHAWLPSAHPVAPAPASAVLSGVITKAGVLGVIRVVYYVVGADFIRGTWVQYAWVTLALMTVFMGSMLAYKEKVLKKRLAYSTVSQVSYIMFGLAAMTPEAFVGAILHVIFHSLAKNTLFMSAGAIIHKTGKTKVDELTGIGKQMPAVMVCFTLASLSLIGIPPLGGFVSKWYLAVGALDSGVPVASWLGPIILLISALLTAGYLLPIAIHGFFPQGEVDAAQLENREPTWQMLLPMIVMAALSIVLGIWTSGLVELLGAVAETIL